MLIVPLKTILRFNQFDLAWTRCMFECNKFIFTMCSDASNKLIVGVL